MDKIVSFLMVGLGGAAGSMLRYGCNLLIVALNLPGQVSTFFVNILGSFLIGLFTGCCKEGALLLMLTIGLCGGFTTFSTFSMQNVRMIQDGKIGLAAIYIIATVIVCVAMAWLGYSHSVGSSKSKLVVEDRPAPVSKATEIDLHIEALPGGLGVPKGKELLYQLEHLKSVMRSQLKHRGSRVIFVHGVGDGILKQAIRTELDTTYALSCTWNPYGDGATAVTIK